MRIPNYLDSGLFEADDWIDFQRSERRKSKKFPVRGKHEAHSTSKEWKNSGLKVCVDWVAGVINNILANPMLYPLSRLTFCAYLVHPAIMVLTSYVMDGPFHIHNGLIVSHYYLYYLYYLLS